MHSYTAQLQCTNTCIISAAVLQYQCRVCGKPYTSKPHLRAHLWAKHQVGLPLECRWCGRNNFTNMTNLYAHSKYCRLDRPSAAAETGKVRTAAAAAVFVVFMHVHVCV